MSSEADCVKSYDHLLAGAGGTQAEEADTRGHTGDSTSGSGVHHSEVSITGLSLVRTAYCRPLIGSLNMDSDWLNLWFLGWGCFRDWRSGPDVQSKCDDGKILKSMIIIFFVIIMMPSPQDRHSHSRDPRPSLKLKNDRNNEFVIMPGGIVTGHDTPSLLGHSFSKKTFYTPQYCYIWCSAGFSNKQYNRPPHHSLWPLILQITLRFLQWKLLCIRVGEDEARSFRSNLSPSLSLLYAEWGGERVQVMILHRAILPWSH